MPLSEDEERILHEIAQQFYDDDPEFAREVGETTLYTHSVRRLKWSGLGFVAGVAFLIASLSTSYLVAFGGFLVMLGSALYFERNLRKLGKHGLDAVGIRPGRDAHQCMARARESGRDDRPDASGSDHADAESAVAPHARPSTGACGSTAPGATAPGVAASGANASSARGNSAAPPSSAQRWEVSTVAARTAAAAASWNSASARSRSMAARPA